VALQENHSLGKNTFVLLRRHEAKDSVPFTSGELRHRCLLAKTTKLFGLGIRVDFPTSVEPIGLKKKFLTEGTKPPRPLESEMVKHGRYYETGRIGAEVSFSILSKMLGVDGLILNEPAR
jgi:hypothetical protein